MGACASCLDKSEHVSDLGDTTAHATAASSNNNKKGKNNNNGKKAKFARIKTTYWTTPVQHLSKESFVGVCKINCVRAEFDKPAKGGCFVVVNIGQQSFVSAVASDTATPEWNKSHHMVLVEGGPTIARFTVRRSKWGESELVGWTTVDLQGVMKQNLQGVMNHQADNAGSQQLPEGWFPLYDPIRQSEQIGRIQITVVLSGLAELERQLWEAYFNIADTERDGFLTYDEFKAFLLKVVDSKFNDHDLKKLFDAADYNKDGRLTCEEISERMQQTADQRKVELIRYCPISGAVLSENDWLTNLIYMTLVMDSDSGEMLKGGYATEADATRSWVLKLSDWAPHPGTKTPYITLVDRRRKALVEETISPMLTVAMRNMYQNPFASVLQRSGAFDYLKKLSIDRGKLMDSPESKHHIQDFLDKFRGEINMDESKLPVEAFQTFNQFFYRELKPEARPIAGRREEIDASGTVRIVEDDPDILVSAADCRLMAFQTVSGSTKFWIKSKLFSVRAMLNECEGSNNGSYAERFANGHMFIFRLAPQDYHRFHFPVDGTIIETRDVPGKYYTVNPIAVSSPYVTVYCENKRCIFYIKSPQFGLVAFVAIGATLVGSIERTAKLNQPYRRGDELGYFAFGGSTCILLLQPGTVEIDADLLENSEAKHLETLVRVGERLGVRAWVAAAKKVQQSDHDMALQRHGSDVIATASDAAV